MPFSLDNAQVYDIETFPNVFTLASEALHSDLKAVWEISHYRDDRQKLFEWFNWLHVNQIPMIGFNNLHFDYQVIHFIFTNPNCTVEQIYAKAMSIINGVDKFAGMIWASERFAPQIDLFKIHHFDNKAKTTSLKALEINMRSENVVDMPVEIGTLLTPTQTEILIDYNRHDTGDTKKFAWHSMKAIEFRIAMIDQFGIDVLNYNDTKIGAKLLENKIGSDICYSYTSGRRQIRQTIRIRIDLSEIIFSYIQFSNPEFNRVLNYLKSQVLTIEEIDQFGQEKTENTKIKTKGVFNDLSASVGNLDFHFGTGGIHGSVPAQRIVSSDEWLIRDIDVASLYPNIAIVNNLAPAHLGEVFTREYAELPKERKKWQELKGKKCVEANSFKLASNGTYGNSNNPFSVFYDPQYTLATTINGQLMLCMLAEWLLTVPTIRLIQINTDGITYLIHKDYEPKAAEICEQWESYTKLTLESVNYKRIFIRDVNSYVAESFDGSLKQKGAYWTPDAGENYANSISEAQPPAWHKDLSNLVSIRAAVAHMIYGYDIESFIKLQFDPFDFMLRAKVPRGSTLLHGNAKVQNTSRYYVAKQGLPLVKNSPATGELGQFKRKNGLSDNEFNRLFAEIGPNKWDERIHTKNKSVYENREMSFQAGWKVALCNNALDFDFQNVNYDFYVNEARKLVI